MLKPVIHDTILYGNSFLQITLGNSIVKLQRLEPTDLEFTIDWVQEPPFKSYAEKIVEIKKQGDSSIVYDTNLVLHFKGDFASYEPVGGSIWGFWFNTWYILRGMSEMVPLLDLQGEKNSDLKAFRDFEEPSVLGAAALPHDLIFPWMQKQAEVVKREHGRFQRENERRRDGISYAVERHLFPKILGRKYEYQTFPQFKWQIV